MVSLVSLVTSECLAATLVAMELRFVFVLVLFVLVLFVHHTLCFDLPLRGLLLSLLLLLLRLLALLVCSSLPALSHHILPFHPVRVLVAGALVRI